MENEPQIELSKRERKELRRTGRLEEKQEFENYVMQDKDKVELRFE
ncbi:MAG TPA: hypothetical protein VJL09_01495 [Candidatus Paceibacterota bacterium]